MTIFVPEWVEVSGRELRVKRVLATLDDEHVVRRPLRRDTQAAALVVQHASRGWLLIDVERAPFNDINGSQLFDSPLRRDFEARLERLARTGVPALMLMWSCTIEETRALSREFLGRHGVRLIAKDQFIALGAKLVHGLLAPVPLEREHRLRAAWFPESEIPPECLPRRTYRRDNRATLVRTFLDPEQEWATKLDLDVDLDLPDEHAALAKDFSVRLVNGVAGSGKTLIAMRRALLLSELFPHQRVLVLIHNTPIVADLEARWKRALGGRLPRNLEVTTFFAWAHRQWRRVFASTPRMPEDPRQVPNLIAELRTRFPGLALTEAQLLDELGLIDESLVADEAAYLDFDRAGRGFALRPRERRHVWALRAALLDRLAQRGLRLWSALPRELGLADPQRLRDRLQHSRHVLIDEAQFFAPSWFQLVKHAMEPGGHLFVCADPNQGFLRRATSWKTVGLDVAGRTKKLQRSYRTTRAILETAGSLLVAANEGNDADDYLAPDYAGMDRGVRPVLVRCASPRDAVERLVNELAALEREGAMPRHAALVIYGDNAPKLALHRRLEQAFGTGNVWWFNDKQQKKAPPRGDGREPLRMASIDTATGLEAGVVFLIGVDRLLRACSRASADDAHREENLRKLYMAMTRAAQRLVVLASQRVPPDIERLFEREDAMPRVSAQRPPPAPTRTDTARPP